MTEAESQVWVVDDDRSIRWVLEKALRRSGHGVRTFESGDAALEALRREEPDVLITDLRMPGLGGHDLLQQVQASTPQLPVIVITAYSDLDAAVSSYEGGAFEYLPKPFDVDEAVDLAGRAIASRRKGAAAEAAGGGSADILGEAPAMQEVFRAIGRLSRSSVTVLLTGESGSGKELVARALHRHSPRSDGPFVALNMAAIPHDLMESELFGHEKGAFTGAQQTRRGRFEQADGGTLFLDEIGDMPADLQTRLLRVLADGEFYRVGAHTAMKVDVRIIAATHQDLEQRVVEGRFREDLYHRLNVIRIQLPPLRERREDIPALARRFLAAAAQELNVDPKALHPDVERELMRLDWPGNVRQLENTCRWLTVMASGQEIVPEDLPADLRRGSPGGSPGGTDSGSGDWEAVLARWAEQALDGGEDHLLDDALPRFERVLIRAALSRSGGHRQEAARLLGWGRNTLTRKIKELGMD
ncbi:nitrogen regulation protein NR(I) [Halorhodospira halophila]|uniref:DNA-binding transcriptional regulator NtrC n=1 Tax=Halorhodospira halophila (strain DSM 244 / SL1) TaxID=349124 RepID=A1WWC8_HALHL|nr:nitrogen regulation protein NR(I) [Halorhodospira halophila]ABM61990.1 nitrogen metabolism transcriptional regulator, NtrC, Fis Family [Halorhodospira halophila SL1]MBK1729682.1 nitrogen regulation protein NR(I) [Halorhodospira halophila]